MSVWPDVLWKEIAQTCQNIDWHSILRHTTFSLLGTYVRHLRYFSCTKSHASYASGAGNQVSTYYIDVIKAGSFGAVPHNKHTWHWNLLSLSAFIYLKFIHQSG
jgi:hypothetical protein